jgi:CRISPR-associated endonuclease/helicase Cas3
MTLRHERFSDFYAALYGHEPFPWQRMLAQRVIEEGWPECLDLPTASGKTACLDIAVFALACQADRPLAKRTAARRIFFVVDRRLVVDSAYDRAVILTIRLRQATNGVLRDVADCLRSLHDEEQPLAAARIRGGITRDDGWVRSPAQPTIITGTVDQVGSRLLFRAYGAGQLTAPIHAALVANDSLIILDEAHCAVPFFETVKAVERYRATDWAPQLLPAPLRVVVMSATPPVGAIHVFPGAAERGAALDHPILNRRRTSKPAELAVARKPKSPRQDEAGLRGAPLSNDELVLDAADRAIRFAASGSQRIAVMVNRVATARAIHNQLQAERALDTDPLDADVVLMTGRMRPINRDDLLECWGDTLQAREEQRVLARAVIVVTTQCLEVGADFSFDALVTECASVDALRQRFGRLDRFGTVGAPRACVLIRAGQIGTEEQIGKLERDGKADDPIYGYALARTWNWMNAHADKVGSDGRSHFLDFGISAMDALLPGDATERRDTLATLSAPAPDAPVMLPPHVDCWVQTAPRPTPDPDIAVFLHGPSRGEPEVHVVLRADLDPDRRGNAWLEAVSLCPPTSLEAFSVPLRLVRAWLGGQAEADEGGDVEGAAIEEDASVAKGRRSAVLWRGRKGGLNRSMVTTDPSDVRPYDLVVLPASDEQVGTVGDVPQEEAAPRVLDVGDRAFLRTWKRPILRVHQAVLGPWARHPAVAALLRWSSVQGRDEDEGDELSHLLAKVAEATQPVEGDDGTTTPPLPKWMRQAAQALRDERRREVTSHPCDSGYVVTSRVRVLAGERVEEEAFADDDDLTSDSDGAVPLREHLDAVAEVARAFARHCLPENLAEVVVQAAALHDLGKADWRFQVWLNKGNEIEALRRGHILAKSDHVPRSLAARRRARALAHLPEGFRHELLSVQIAVSVPQLIDGADVDLLLHLIASHHGHCRPFAPVISDNDPPDVNLAELGFPGSLSGSERLNMVAIHRLDSGIAERFWQLTRQYGWWGLAYLEAIVRLADWEASDRHEKALMKAEANSAEGGA